MAVIDELIRTEENGKLSFGDYTLAAKAKLDNFEKDGDIYKVKTFKEITKLERNRTLCIRVCFGNSGYGFRGDC